MMLEPSIDKLLQHVDSKYSLVVLEAKRAHELRDGERPTMEFKSVKRTLQALEEIAAGTVTIHPSPDAKRETLKEKRELERLQQKWLKNLSANKSRKKKPKKKQNKKVIVQLKQLQLQLNKKWYQLSKIYFI